jgi:hypothetical protein
MPSTYSTDLRIELIANGEQSGTWGSTTNTNLGTLIEDAIAGQASVSVTSADQALTAQNGAADQARCAALSLTTTTGANFAVYVPPVTKLYVVTNPSGYTATVYASTVLGNTTAAGAGVAIPTGKSVLLRSDGTNIVEQLSHVVGAFSVGGALAVTGNATVTGNLTVSGNIPSPTLTGVPVAPTAALSTNTTQVATTAFVQATLAAAYPVGSIYINATSSTNPATLLGFGTWVAFGAGRVMVGLDAGNAAFDTAEETGGSADAIVVSHTHTATDSGHTHTLDSPRTPTGGVIGGTSNTPAAAPAGSTVPTTASGTANITVASTGSSGTNANLQPYIVVYMWKRTV